MKPIRVQESLLHCVTLYLHIICCSFIPDLSKRLTIISLIIQSHLKWVWGQLELILFPRCISDAWFEVVLRCLFLYTMEWWHGLFSVYILHIKKTYWENTIVLENIPWNTTRKRDITRKYSYLDGLLQTLGSRSRCLCAYAQGVSYSKK